ncbi:MAG TPA: helicase C-terminal domain-containing protein [Ktedonobacteraceae bacterium]|nr:helicase C-terminal domain-containing protein [Ktedonobacteraceae bacterium]
MTMVDVGLEQIGSYATIRLLYESSTGRAYLGKHPQRKKYVVIKLFRTPFRTPEAREAFLAHAKKLKKLKHRNIAEIQDAGFVVGTGGNEEYGYHVIQYVLEDEQAQRFVEGQQYSPVEVKRVISIVADALNYAHQTNTLHSNIHPGNLLFARNNDILLTDFSPLPQTQGQGEIIPLNTTGKSLLYMAPEQLRGVPVAASDQYSLAVMAFEWLCGRRPYLANEPGALLAQQEHEPLPSPQTFNSAISPQVEQVLLKALALNPEDRFSNVQKFADAYLRALMGIPMAEPLETKHISASRSEPVATVQNTQQPVSKNDGKEIKAASPVPAARKSRKVKSTALAPASADLDDVKVAPRVPISASQENIDAEQKSVVPIATQSRPSTATTDEIPEENAGIEDQFAATVSEVYDEVMETVPDVRDSQYSLEEIVSADLQQGGILSRRLPGYEERAAQIEMAQLVAQSLTGEAPAIIEASTGTGKSLAYLIPIVRSGRVAIISTANKALQEQLFFKDIPFVQKHIQPFDAALVKGMANYVCLDRLEEERNGIQHLVKNRDFTRLVDIINDPDSSFTGDFETLGFTLPADIRSKVYAERDQCTWGKCPFFKDCYVRKMKVKAGYAKVVVVNHTLLLIDAELEGFLLPDRDVIVVDEAHHLEEEATRVFTVKVSYGQVTTLLAQRLLKDHSSVSLQDEAEHTAKITWERLSQIADPGYNKGRTNLVETLEEGLALAKVLDQLANSLRQLRPKTMTEKEDQMYDMLIARTKNLAANMRTVFSVDQPDKFVYYVERVNAQGRRGGQLEVFAAPLEVSSWLKERLFDKYNVICTSATLATIGPDPQKPADRGPNFVYFRRRVGLDRRDYPNVQERILPLTFDYEHNAVLYIPRHLPEPVYGSGPEAIRYTKSIAREMMKLVEASRGRAFLLFSSRRMLEEVFDEFCRSLPSHLDYPLLRQGDMTRLELTRTFRETQGAILFGLKSFWEGVDIAGEALSLVVIDKLPFDPPDDPVHEARVARMKAAGENWFGSYVLPQTVLRLKQGLGRLLRTHDDRGVMAILDTRLHTKGYGRLILNALPPARRTASLRDVEEFFRGM